MKNDVTPEKVRAGQPYLYRKNGLPSEVYEIRMKEEVSHRALCDALEITLERYPYFRVRYEEHKGDFYVVSNTRPFKVHETDKNISLGGEENNYYLIGVCHHRRSICVSFHHGLTDGRGIKSFVETLIFYYCEMAYASNASSYGILTIEEKLDGNEMAEPCGEKYDIHNTKLKRIKGLSRKAFVIPETKGAKAAHRRYEMKFSQKDFMKLCKQTGVSPIVMLSIMMSRSIRELYPENNEVINSNFPVDARTALQCEGTYKNCVKSISLPYGDIEANMSMEELGCHYKLLMNEQRAPERCKDEFNKIIMLLNIVNHLPSFNKKRGIMRILDDLKLDTYLISYIGQFTFNENERYIDSVHLYSDCTTGLVMNMTCQCGNFIIDFTQDFISDKYVKALSLQFEKLGVEIDISEEIIFSTPCDTLMRDMPVKKQIEKSLQSKSMYFTNFSIS